MAKPVFISYATEDSEIAHQVCGFLEREGLACWIAPDDVRPGFDYSDEIMEGIEGARAVVLLLSEGANASHFVRREIQQAVSLGRPVVPFRLRAVLPSRGLAYLLSGTQWIDAWTPPPEAQLGTLAQAVRDVAGLPASDRQPHRQEVETVASPGPGAAAPVPAAAATVAPERPGRQPRHEAFPAPEPDPQPHRQVAEPAAPPAPGAAAPSGAAAPVSAPTVTPGPADHGQPQEASPPPEPAKPAAPKIPPPRRWRRLAAVAAGLAAVGVAALMAMRPPSEPPVQAGPALAPRTPESAAVTGQPGSGSAEQRPPVEVLAGTFPQPQSVFRDRTANGSPCPDCPEMVVVPAGSFTMGSPASESERDSDEGPQHRVTIGSALAVGRYEVTRGEFAAFVSATNRSMSGGCSVLTGSQWQLDSSRNWQTPGFGQDNRHPAVCVSWEDAQAYVQWLSQRTGKPYRLLSESEWEYAARAGTTTARWWGDDPNAACAFANVYDAAGERVNHFGWTRHQCDDGYAQTAQVGSFRANGFGLYDMLGNVWEWVDDCYEGSYTGASNDGGARTSCSDNNTRVLRGGSWGDDPRVVRSANRVRNAADYRVISIGFRVARTF